MSLYTHYGPRSWFTAAGSLARFSEQFCRTNSASIFKNDGHFGQGTFYECVYAMDPIAKRAPFRNEFESTRQKRGGEKATQVRGTHGHE